MRSRGAGGRFPRSWSEVGRRRPPLRVEPPMIAISGRLQLIYLRLPREVRTQLDDCGLAEVLAVSLDFLVSGSVVEEMLANNVAVHHIEDWLSVRILRECSSPCCFADLKFLSVQPGLPELDSTARDRALPRRAAARVGGGPSIRCERFVEQEMRP